MPDSPLKATSAIIAYKPQLDGMRFIAVFIVLVYHYLPTYQMIGGILDIGTLLAFFFVLSSYLITTILLTSKQKGLDLGYSKTKIAQGFLIRRTLRIFPAYYAYIALILLLPIAAGQYLKDNAWVHIFYVSNFYNYVTQSWGEASAHLWTLAVEEQFYLIWPWLILFVPEKHLTKVFYAVISLGILSRFVLYHYLESPDTDNITMLILTPTCLDGFGFGAWLAYLHYNGKTSNPWILKALLLVTPLWLAGMYYNMHGMSMVVDRVFVALGTMAILDKAFTGFTGIIASMLENKIVLYMAKISYGIYLYHMFAWLVVWELVWDILTKVKILIHDLTAVDLSPLLNMTLHPVMVFVSNMILSVLLATLSWYIIEKPFNSLKRYFTFSKKPAVKAIEEPQQVLATNDAPAAFPEHSVKL